MRKRLLALFGVLVLGVAACSADSLTTSTTLGDTTSTTSPAATNAVLAAYVLEAGATYTYEVELSQHISMDVQGDASTLGSEEFPGDSEVDITGSATFTQSVADGPEPGTYAITITGEFTDLAVTGTVAGEPVDEVPDFAQLDPIDVTVVVDEKGNVIGGNDGLTDSLDGALFDPGALDPNALPGLSPGQFLGPALPDGDIGVGDTWDSETEIPGLGPNPIVTTTMSTVTGSDVIEGLEVLVVDTTTSTSRVEIDLGKMLVGFFGAFVPEGATAEEMAELDEIIENLRFLIFIDDASADSRSWIAPEDGMVWRAESRSGALLGMDLSMPDEETGEIVEATVNMTMTQELTYRINEGPSA